MGGLRTSGQSIRSKLRGLHRLSLIQWALLLPGLGLAIALLLTAVQSVWSFVLFLVARSRGPEAVCDTLPTMGEIRDLTIVARPPWGYACEATFADGSVGTQEQNEGSMTLFLAVVLLVVASVIMLLGVLCAVVVRSLLRLFLRRTDGRLNRWGWTLTGLGCLLLPWAWLFTFVARYSGSNSPGGPICPSSVDGEGVLGYSAEANYLLPSVTCSGVTVDGTEFSMTHFGIPFAMFCVSLALVMAGIIVLITAQVARARQRPTLSRSVNSAATSPPDNGA
ncbi:hypothetical protein [Brevibacterium celere]|uniref:hypothetical protein n=1 Tax=Brevibacterium celere TaxID=225845 RepID=UPI0031E06564